MFRGTRKGGQAPLFDRGVCLLSWLAGAVLAGCIFFGLSVVAEAQEPPPGCPSAPVAYEGTDEVVNELRAARQDSYEACNAIQARLDLLDTRGANTLSKLEEIRDLTSSFPFDNADQLAQLELIAGHTDPVNAPPGGDNAPVVDAVDAAQLEIDAALWFLAGLICSLFAGSLFAREVLGNA